MTCQNCGLLNPDIAERCDCGYNFKSNATKCVTECVPHPRGIGGWLKFLIICLIVLGPLMSFSETIQAFEDAELKLPALLSTPEWLRYKTLAWVNLGVSSFISMVSGCLLATVYRSASVRFTIASFWLFGPAAQLADLLTAAFCFRPNVMRVENVGGALAATTLAAAAWTWYLVRSKRVRNTYYVTPSSATPPSAL